MNSPSAPQEHDAAATAMRMEDSSRSSTTAIRVALRIRSTLLQRRLRAEVEQGSARALGIVALGLAVAGVIFAAGLGGGFYVVMKGAPELVRTGTNFILLGLSAALVLSSVGHAAAAFFSSRDLWFWDAAPAPTWARFTDRLVETAVAALPGTLVLGACGLMGVAAGGGLGFGGMVRAAAAVGLVVVVPLSLGIALAHLGGALLPAGTLRRLSMLVLGVGVAVVLVWFRNARVEKALSPQGAAELLASARAVKSLGPELLPPSLGAAFIADTDLVAGVLLVAWSGLSLLLAFVAHVVFARRARNLAVDESPVGLLRGSVSERMLSLAVRPLRETLRPMVEKDLLAFVRDPAQWGQVVLLLGVGALYLVNADALREGFEQMPEVGAAVLPAMHTGLVCFIAGGLAVRFGFPQLGLEGPAVWIIDGSPMTPRALLTAKWIAALPLVALYPTLIGAIGGAVLELRPGLWILTTLLCASVSAGVAAYAVGRGALKPLFDATSLSELAMGPGAISTMMASVALAAFASMGTLGAGIALGAERARMVSGATAALAATVACAAPALVALSVGRAALASGARAFGCRRIAGDGAPARVRDPSHVPIAADI